MRLDQALVSRGLARSRAQAQSLIKDGRVRVDDGVAVKASSPVREGSVIELDGAAHPFASRGGVKLEAALRTFEADPRDKICLDLGASTGGFTDVLLRAGAAKIYAVDVGHGQLRPEIAGDPRVLNLEKTHAKDLTRAIIPDEIELLVCDVSFISLKKALPPALALTVPGARLVALVKPQFEVGRSRIGKGGVVRPGRENAEGVAENLARWLGEQKDWTSVGWIESPITGGNGNREFLLGAVRSGR